MLIDLHFFGVVVNTLPSCSLVCALPDVGVIVTFQPLMAFPSGALAVMVS